MFHTCIHIFTVFCYVHVFFHQTIAHTSDKVTQSLEQHFLWSELTVLSRFLLALSFTNKANGELNRMGRRWKAWDSESEMFIAGGRHNGDDGTWIISVQIEWGTCLWCAYTCLQDAVSNSDDIATKYVMIGVLFVSGWLPGDPSYIHTHMWQLRTAADVIVSSCSLNLCNTLPPCLCYCLAIIK